MTTLPKHADNHHRYCMAYTYSTAPMLTFTLCRKYVYAWFVIEISRNFAKYRPSMPTLAQLELYTAESYRADTFKNRILTKNLAPGPTSLDLNLDFLIKTLNN